MNLFPPEKFSCAVADAAGATVNERQHKLASEAASLSDAFCSEPVETSVGMLSWSDAGAISTVPPGARAGPSAAPEPTRGGIIVDDASSSRRAA